METTREKSILTGELAGGPPTAFKQKSGGEALYLFCLVPAPHLPRLKDAGVHGLPAPAAEGFREITAILSPVALEEFCGPGGEANLQDPSWLAPRLARHQEVISGLMRHSPLLPLPFGTLFSSRDSLARCLARHRRAIRDFWEEVAGREEWAVKGFLDRDRARQRLFSRPAPGRERSWTPCLPGRAISGSSGSAPTWRAKCAPGLKRRWREPGRLSGKAPPPPARAACCPGKLPGGNRKW